MLLNMAVHTLEASVCSCCGQYVDEAYDEATAGRWQPVVQKCYAGEALSEFKREHEDELKDSLVYVRLLPEGEEPSDPLRYDRNAARREFEAQQKRLRLA